MSEIDKNFRPPTPEQAGPLQELARRDNDSYLELTDLQGVKVKPKKDKDPAEALQIPARWTALTTEQEIADWLITQANKNKQGLTLVVNGNDITIPKSTSVKKAKGAPKPAPLATPLSVTLAEKFGNLVGVSIEDILAHLTEMGKDAAPAEKLEIALYKEFLSPFSELNVAPDNMAVLLHTAHKVHDKFKKDSAAASTEAESIQQQEKMLENFKQVWVEMWTDKRASFSPLLSQQALYKENQANWRYIAAEATLTQGLGPEGTNCDDLFVFLETDNLIKDDVNYLELDKTHKEEITDNFGIVLRATRVAIVAEAKKESYQRMIGFLDAKISRLDNGQADGVVTVRGIEETPAIRHNGILLTKAELLWTRKYYEYQQALVTRGQIHEQLDLFAKLACLSSGRSLDTLPLVGGKAKLYDPYHAGKDLFIDNDYFRATQEMIEAYKDYDQNTIANYEKTLRALAWSCTGQNSQRAGDLLVAKTSATVKSQGNEYILTREIIYYTSPALRIDGVPYKITRLSSGSYKLAVGDKTLDKKEYKEYFFKNITELKALLEKNIDKLLNSNRLDKVMAYSAMGTGGAYSMPGVYTPDDQYRAELNNKKDAFISTALRLMENVKPVYSESDYALKINDKNGVTTTHAVPEAELSLFCPKEVASDLLSKIRPPSSIKALVRNGIESTALFKDMFASNTVMDPKAPARWDYKSLYGEDEVHRCLGSTPEVMQYAYLVVDIWDHYQTTKEAHYTGPFGEYRIYPKDIESGIGKKADHVLEIKRGDRTIRFLLDTRSGPQVQVMLDWEDHTPEFSWLNNEFRMIWDNFQNTGIPAEEPYYGKYGTYTVTKDNSENGRYSYCIEITTKKGETIKRYVKTGKKAKDLRFSQPIIENTGQEGVGYMVNGRKVQPEARHADFFNFPKSTSARKNVKGDLMTAFVVEHQYLNDINFYEVAEEKRSEALGKLKGDLGVKTEGAVIKELLGEDGKDFEKKIQELSQLMIDFQQDNDPASNMKTLKALIPRLEELLAYFEKLQKLADNGGFEKVAKILNQLRFTGIGIGDGLGPEAKLEMGLTAAFSNVDQMRGFFNLMTKRLSGNIKTCKEMQKSTDNLIALKKSKNWKVGIALAVTVAAAIASVVTFGAVGVSSMTPIAGLWASIGIGAAVGGASSLTMFALNSLVDLGLGLITWEELCSKESLTEMFKMVGMGVLGGAMGGAMGYGLGRMFGGVIAKLAKQPGRVQKVLELLNRGATKLGHSAGGKLNAGGIYLGFGLYEGVMSIPENWAVNALAGLLPDKLMDNPSFAAFTYIFLGTLIGVTSGSIRGSLGDNAMQSTALQRASAAKAQFSSHCDFVNKHQISIVPENGDFVFKVGPQVEVKDVQTQFNIQHKKGYSYIKSGNEWIRVRIERTDVPYINRTIDDYLRIPPLKDLPSLELKQTADGQKFTYEGDDIPRTREEILAPYKDDPGRYRVVEDGNAAKITDLGTQKTIDLAFPKSVETKVFDIFNDIDPKKPLKLIPDADGQKFTLEDDGAPRTRDELLSPYKNAERYLVVEDGNNVRITDIATGRVVDLAFPQKLVPDADGLYRLGDGPALDKKALLDTYRNNPDYKVTETPDLAGNTAVKIKNIKTGAVSELYLNKTSDYVRAKANLLEQSGADSQLRLDSDIESHDPKQPLRGGRVAVDNLGTYNDPHNPQKGLGHEGTDSMLFSIRAKISQELGVVSPKNIDIIRCGADWVFILKGDANTPKNFSKMLKVLKKLSTGKITVEGASQRNPGIKNDQVDYKLSVSAFELEFDPLSQAGRSAAREYIDSLRPSRNDPNAALDQVQNKHSFEITSETDAANVQKVDLSAAPLERLPFEMGDYNTALKSYVDQLEQVPGTSYEALQGTMARTIAGGLGSKDIASVNVLGKAEYFGNYRSIGQRTAYTSDGKKLIVPIADPFGRVIGGIEISFKHSQINPKKLGPGIKYIDNSHTPDHKSYYRIFAEHQIYKNIHEGPGAIQLRCLAYTRKYDPAFALYDSSGRSAFYGRGAEPYANKIQGLGETELSAIVTNKSYLPEYREIARAFLEDGFFMLKRGGEEFHMVIHSEGNTDHMLALSFDYNKFSRFGTTWGEGAGDIYMERSSGLLKHYLSENIRAIQKANNGTVTPEQAAVAMKQSIDQVCARKIEHEIQPDPKSLDAQLGDKSGEYKLWYAQNTDGEWFTISAKDPASAQKTLLASGETLASDSSLQTLTRRAVLHDINGIAFNTDGTISAGQGSKGILGFNTENGSVKLDINQLRAANPKGAYKYNFETGEWIQGEGGTKGQAFMRKLSLAGAVTENTSRPGENFLEKNIGFTDLKAEEAKVLGNDKVVNKNTDYVQESRIEVYYDAGHKIKNIAADVAVPKDWAIPKEYESFLWKGESFDGLSELDQKMFYYIAENFKLVSENYYKLALEDYGTKNVFNPDLAKNSSVLPGYAGENAGDFHRASCFLADIVLGKITSAPDSGGVGSKKVLFYVGGPGSGKSSSARGSGLDFKDYGLIFDQTGGYYPELKSQILKMQSMGAEIDMRWVLRTPEEAFINGVMTRVMNPDDGRVLSVDYFIKSYRSVETSIMDGLQADFPDVYQSLKFIDNTGDAKSVKPISERGQTAKPCDYSEAGLEAVRSKLIDYVEEKYKNKDKNRGITKEQYAALLKQE